MPMCLSDEMFGWLQYNYERVMVCIDSIKKIYYHETRYGQNKTAI